MNFGERIASAWKKGVLVAVCGIDGAGKSTLIPAIVNKLAAEGYVVSETHQPTDFYRTGDLSRAYQHGTENTPPHEAMALISAGDRLLHLAGSCVPYMERGEVVVSHRFLAATYAIFQARGIASDWLESINDFCPLPHITVLVDCPGEIAVERIRQRGGETRNDERSPAMLESIRQNYLRVVGSSGCIVDSTKGPVAVQRQALEYVESRIREFPQLSRSLTAGATHRSSELHDNSAG